MASLKSLFKGASLQYTSLPSDDAPQSRNDQQQPEPSGIWHRRNSTALKLSMAIIGLSIVGYLSVLFIRAAHAANPHPQRCDTPELGFQCSPDLSHSWGQYSPYFSVPSEIDPSVPAGCELTFAQVLSRHGARDPTFFRGMLYRKTIAKIHLLAGDYGPGYEFIEDYRYQLGSDQLTLFGQEHMVNSGLKFYQRYQPLASKSIPFIRASGQDRVIESALNFTQGFHSALLADKTSTVPRAFPYSMVTIPETSSSNNTLNNKLCRAFQLGKESGIGANAQATYLSLFAPPIKARLRANLPSVNISKADAVALMDLCAYETVASSKGATISPFCNLFTADEWAAYDYYQALGKWYGFGPGNPLGPTQGVGWVNELLARMTGQPVVDATSTNSTLDDDEETFPLNRTLYADFSHDNDMASIMGALGLYDGVRDLSNTTRTRPEEAGGFSASWAVPFAARLYVEKMVCAREDEELVRVLVNDRVVPVKGCGPDVLGRCTLSKFVESMAFARSGGLWDQCFE
ncbi:histidine phosphatase superfamily [Lasiosphaeria hispida]|uniref:Phytase A n=1 Tax=Lasiosphaeria hispida TaxID=260671 RepID=A0AAJ0HJ94_9PEZI|nr:histidine phosphatase superfamily [Lasiosphaeria hispida]